MSRLVFKNNKMMLDENIKKLVISNNKTIIKEAIEDISLDNAGALITDTVKSTVKISEAIIKNFIANTKFMIQVSLLPLTQNLDSVIKGYETDITNSNKLFLDSIPANVANTAKILSIPATSPAAVFEKMSQEMEKVEGIKEIVNSKLISDINIIGPVKNLLDGTFDTTKDIAGYILRKAFKEIPEKLAGSAYNERQSYTKELQELFNELKGSGISKSSNEGITGKTIKTEQIYQQKLDMIISNIKKYPSEQVGIVKEAYVDNKYESKVIVDAILSILHFNDTSKKFDWKKDSAIAPLNTDTTLRFKRDDFFITIKKDKKIITDIDDLKNCFIALDIGHTQVTNDISFYKAFLASK